MKDNHPQTKVSKPQLEIEDLDNYNNFEDMKNEFSKGKRLFDYKDGTVLFIAGKFIYSLNTKRIHYLMNSKIIYFINKNLGTKAKAYFIHDENSFNKALEKEQINNGILKAEEEENQKEKNIE